MYNLIAYVSYIILVVSIILTVGHYLFKCGQVFIDRSITDASLSVTVNKLLLTGYYLFNLGAAVVVISTWPLLNEPLQVFSSLVYFISRLILVLGCMHYLNIVIIKNLEISK